MQLIAADSLAISRAALCGSFNYAAAAALIAREREKRRRREREGESGRGGVSAGSGRTLSLARVSATRHKAFNTVSSTKFQEAARLQAELSVLLIELPQLRVCVSVCESARYLLP